MVINMQINKVHYKVLKEPEKIYLDMSTVEIREKLNVSFKNPTAEDDMTGIFGKYYKIDKMYKLKYIYKRNNQLQPQTFERYYYLIDIGEDEKGAYIEYVMVYDKLYDPIIRMVYMLAVCAVIAYLFYLYNSGVMQKFSAMVMSVLVLMSSILVFKKSNESQDECAKAELLFKNLIRELE